MKLTPETYVTLALQVTRLARHAIEQVQLAGLKDVSPELRQQLLDERDHLNRQWADLAPEE